MAGDEMFHVKICGVTTPEDALLAIAAGADCIGLNFVPGSPRQLDDATGRSIRAAVPAGVAVVGVFAGATADQIRRTAGVVGLDAIQLHGHLAAETDAAGAVMSGPVDPPELCRDLAPLPVIRAVRLEAALPDGDPLASARRWVAAARLLGHPPVMAIVDASVSRGTAVGQLGGTGAVVDWAALARAKPLDIPMALAGGLAAENVATALAASGLQAVDTASGVEASPGRKDAEKLRRFVAAARGAMHSAGDPPRGCR
jgi:phosphoribosylanthranilate isomerase